MLVPNRSAFEARALALFEELSEADADEREQLLAGISAELLAEIKALEAADARAASFETQFENAGLDEIGPRPQRVGAYRLAALIGEGGMGEVWRAERDDGVFEHEAAVKLVRPGILSSLAAARFAEERQILARVDHPGVARIIDGGIAQGWPYLIMELVDGEPIDAFSRGKTLSVQDRAALMQAVASAAQAAHAALVVHADLKPANILVRPNGQVKLIDFGIATLFSDDRAGMGPQPLTQAYASPERRAGAPPAVADDVYALGVILAELAAGDADRDLAAIAARASAERPQDRYRSADALAADLGRWNDLLPVEARNAGPNHRARLFVRRHPVGIGATAAALSVLAATSLIATVSYVRAENARATATARLADVRDVARYLLYDLQAELQEQPRSLELRARIAARSQTFLNNLVASKVTDREVLLDTAAGLRQLAERQGAPNQPNLGQPAVAAANLTTAIQLLETLGDAEAETLKARIRLDQARLSILVDNDLERSERLLADALRHIIAGRSNASELIGPYLLARASLSEWQGRYLEAIAIARRAAKATHPGDGPAVALFDAGVEDVIGESLFYMGRREASLAPYTRAMTRLEAAHARWPKHQAIARRLSRSRWALGSALTDIGRSGAALPMLRVADEELQTIVAFDPADADTVRLRNINQAALAQALANVGRGEEGMVLLAQGVEARRQLWAKSPGEAMRRRDYALTLIALGGMQARFGRTRDACASYAQAQAQFDGLKASGRITQSDRDYSLRLLSEGRSSRCG